MKLHPVDLCPINGSKGKIFLPIVCDHFFGSPGNWTYYRDAETGHVWLSPRPSDDDIPALYSAYYTHAATTEDVLNSAWNLAVQLILSRRLGYLAPKKCGYLPHLISLLPTVGDAAVIEVLKIHSVEGGRLLDYGCGNGQFMRRMGAAGWDVVGIEPDAVAANMLRQQYGYEVRTTCSDLNDWVGTFDVIALNHVIEHLSNPKQIVEGLVRLLKNNGKLILTTPNSESLCAKLFGRYWRGLEAPRHFNVFTTKSLESLLDQVGLEVIEISTETRLTRGIFYVSAAAAFGQNGIELVQTRSRGLKYLGYIFQLAEAALRLVFPKLGEELFFVCRRKH
ncbi:MAG: class I SAM-dependent methyltransferase [Chlorobium sp.]|nr:class I SAM-dependent methyltransferase [Chlorobium sp.]